ncbi:hypothetical protein, partial [Pontibacter qinzhouensis]|uniref:hypothetical protein n=1 Tax=Pontibacter qinzhouensis TaxID=2603253 RepID=UPI001C9C99BE
ANPYNQQPPLRQGRGLAAFLAPAFNFKERKAVTICPPVKDFVTYQQLTHKILYRRTKNDLS